MNANMKEIENKIEQEKIKLKSNTPSKKEKKRPKKKIKKKKSEKACKNLKELLEQMQQEENEKKLLKKKNLKSNEEKEEKNININNKSTSGTTTGTLSLDDNYMPNYLLINNNNNNENNSNSSEKNELTEEKITIKRKMSSPIFDYYIGCDKFLSKEIKDFHFQTFVNTFAPIHFHLWTIIIFTKNHKLNNYPAKINYHLNFPF